MSHLRSLLLAAIVLFSGSANAFVIADIISVNKILDIGWYAFTFDLTKYGYNHKTDTIIGVHRSYDFSQMVDDFDDYDDMNTVESIQMNSYIFDGRINYYDINPEIISEHTSWTKDESYCEKENYNTGECEFNLDRFGTAEEFLAIYSNNIWVGDVTFWVDVNRVPESSSFMLLLFGLALIALGRAKSIANTFK